MSEFRAFFLFFVFPPVYFYVILEIIELKQGVQNMKPVLSLALKGNHVYQRGFSKYCIGRALSEKKLKRDQFKSRLLKIGHQIN